jgi:hypothetical protein
VYLANNIRANNKKQCLLLIIFFYIKININIINNIKLLVQIRVYRLRSPTSPSFTLITNSKP